MEEHAKVGQQRIDALSVQGHKGELVEGIGHHCCHGQEEGQSQHQNCGCVGHGVFELFWRSPNRDARHDCQDSSDVEQRALVACIEGHPGEPVVHRQVTVGRHVGNLKVAADKSNDQAQGGNE